ncbi:MAG TPA: hypothetical protein VF407_22365 [Polyangiaceae bacterium]
MAAPTDGGTTPSGVAKTADGGFVSAKLPDGGVIPAQGTLPSGHPTIANDQEDDQGPDQEDQPDQEDPPQTNPHGGTQPHQGGMPGVFQPPADEASEDAKLPKGTIVIAIHDADDKPIANASVLLGIVHNSVAKGESHDHLTKTTDDKGEVRFDDLEATSSVAYRVSSARGDANFSATPFRLPEDKGERVVLHVYDVTSDIQEALIVSQAVMYVELKDDRIQLEEAITIFNFGKTAWVPKDVIFQLPEGFTALNGQQSMSAQGIDPVEKQGAKLHGTFAPGRGQIEFRWQLPYAGESEAHFDVGMPPHLAAIRVMAVAADPMKLAVEGFGEPHPDQDGEGNRVLVVDKQMRPNDAPLKSLSVTLHDIPTPGPARFVATGIAAVGIVFGLVLTTRRRTKNEDKGGSKKERLRLLADLEDLERAKIAGDVGPKTYERARREIIDAIARTLG